jgi:signal transduction histidine kinase
MEADRANQRDGSFFQTSVNDRTYRVIRIQGTRIVDPGDKGGGIPRTVTIYYGSSTKRVWIAVWRTVSFYAASSLLVLACTGILMSWLLNRGLAPLRDLALAASRVSVSSWTFQPPEEAHETKELAPLAMALESLLQGLQHSFEQQKRFLGDATHELKTSVAVVKSSLQLLGMKQRSAAEYQAGMKRCLSDCERMEAIVAQMLTLSRLEEGHAAEPTGYETNIIRCVREVAAAMETMAEVNGIQILIHGDPSITADVEPEQFKLLCTNLLMNALQHSTSHSDVSVDLKLEDSHAKLEISDAGEGIAPEHLPRIFERFARTDPSRARKTGGTGLGLAISQAIVVRFGGTIEIRSELNAGTTVRVQFPTLVTDRNSVD